MNTNTHPSRRTRTARRAAAAFLVCAFPAILSAAEWRCSFEAAEGFFAGVAPQHAQVSVIGGAAAIVGGGAASGAQFLRFVPQEESNALVLQLPASVGAADDRTISFAIRLVGEPDSTRLVLSYRETIALRWTNGGVEIEAGGGARERVHVPAEQGGSPWIGVTLSERADGWSLAVNGSAVVARSLAESTGSGTFAELLIFADGSLDLDSVHVVAEPGEGADSRLTEAGDRARERGQIQHPEFRATLRAAQAAALKRAQAGELGAAEAVILSALPADATLAERAEAAGALVSTAFVLRQEGRGREAVALGRAALRQLQQVGRSSDAATDPALDARVSFLSGQLQEIVLLNRAEAKRLYERVLARDAQHTGARSRSDVLARQATAAAPRSTKTSGGNP